MTLELIPEHSHNFLFLLVLIVNLLFMIVLLKSHEKIRRRMTMILSLTVTCTAALAVINSFVEYTLEGLHILSHTVFGVILLLSARLLIREKIPPFLYLFVLLELNIFDRLQYTLAQMLMSFFKRVWDSLELNIFDRLQYSLVQVLVSFAGNIKRVQTGDLGLNMIGVVIGLILCLLLFLLLGFICF